jgi:hypothetical protein
VQQRRLLGIVAVVAVLLCCGSPTTVHADTANLKWSATLQDQPSDSVDPIAIGDTDVTKVTLALQNVGPTEIRIRSVRLSGRVFGLKFFSFSSLVDIALPPNASTTRTVEFDATDLRTEALGWIPATLTLVGPDREPIDHKDVRVDVRGSIFSVYGIFGLAVAGITAILIVSLLLAISRRELPGNRWRRALGFFSIGLGLALTVTFTLSSMRLLMPNPAAWVTLLLALGATSFLLGYFLPLGKYAHSDQASPDSSRLVSTGP